MGIWGNILGEMRMAKVDMLGRGDESRTRLFVLGLGCATYGSSEQSLGQVQISTLRISAQRVLVPRSLTPTKFFMFGLFPVFEGKIGPKHEEFEGGSGIPWALEGGGGLGGGWFLAKFFMFMRPFFGA